VPLLFYGAALLLVKGVSASMSIVHMGRKVMFFQLAAVVSIPHIRRAVMPCLCMLCTGQVGGTQDAHGAHSDALSQPLDGFTAEHVLHL
jgi:hypothetical protein